jgi:ribonuclease HI
MDRINDPRMTGTERTDSRTLTPVMISTSFLAQQVTRKPFVPWTDFRATLQHDRMVHVITDAGWGAIIRQNWRCTFNFGHYDRATNNAMEISTDSAYVKRGIIDWLPGWISNNWWNSSNVPVANKTLWQKFIEMVSRVHKIEWPWVKAHSGILLNECADTLATKGVFNEPAQSLVQFVVPVGEDTDTHEYEMMEGEARPVED